MKRTLAYALAAALLAACTTQEKDFQTPAQDDAVFYASFEQPVEEGTKVYANEDLLLRWTADDRVSIFNKNTYNQEYRFIGETGDYEGGFNKVGDPEFITGKEIAHVVSVYPYQRLTRVTEDETVHVTLPAEQPYAENSFGLGANTMLSVSTGNLLYYKNVGGYLMLKLYGEGVTVSSITLKGNNGEKLAGNATVSMPVDGNPSLAMASDASTEITLTCETPVQLGASAAESTQFWFVVPAVTFSKGFTVTVSGDGGVFEKSTDKSLTIERNNLSKMSPIEVELSRPKSVIYYTSSDGQVVTPYDTDVFGAAIVSNEYVGGKGIITFGGEVNSIGQLAFFRCSSLTSIEIPSSVTSIDGNPFWGCSGLTSIVVESDNPVFDSRNNCNAIIKTDNNELISGCKNTVIPGSVASIGGSAFSDCSELTSIDIPDSVTSIGNSAFSGCIGLTSIEIPNSVTSIGTNAFGQCVALSSIVVESGNPVYDSRSNCNAIIVTDTNELIVGCKSTVIPSSVTSIGSYAFNGCSGLTSIVIPESVTSIGSYAFNLCSGLTSIGIPDSVTVIGDSAFFYCISLTRIDLPDSLQSIGRFAFRECSGLTSIDIPNSVTSIEDWAFSLCTSLTTVTISNSVTEIGIYAFADCPNLESITVLASAPPSLGSNAFYRSNDCPIYVPAGSVDAYKTAWSEYADRIRAIPDTREAVDLGLSVKWATCNVGAISPEENGNYFAWGETNPKSDYSWDVYSLCNGDSASLTKYNTNSDYGIVDHKTVLDLSDDAAHVNWGGNWRMPTDAELTELRENCNWTWTTQNGKKGYRVTSQRNENSIFLPAAGYYKGSAFYSDGLRGFYSSSSIRLDYPYLDWYVNFASNQVIRYHGERSHGHSIRPVYGEFNGVSSVTLNKSSLTLTAGGFENLISTVMPSNATEKTVTWTSSNTSVATVSSEGVVTAVSAGTATITVWASDGEHSATCTVRVQAPASGTENGHDWVDLGLPSGLKWASCNVGASSSEEYGDYFAWGETAPKSSYDWPTYKWCDGTIAGLTKYNTKSNLGVVDNLSVLELDDDVARMSWGGEWRIPTEEEFRELMTNCTWTWTTLNGVNGYSVSSTSNGNSVFFPAAGWQDIEDLKEAGHQGEYWSITLNAPDSPYSARSLYFFLSGHLTINNRLRCNGLPVRPVLE